MPFIIPRASLVVLLLGHRHHQVLHRVLDVLDRRHVHVVRRLCRPAESPSDRHAERVHDRRSSGATGRRPASAGQRHPEQVPAPFRPAAAIGRPTGTGIGRPCRPWAAATGGIGISCSARSSSAGSPWRIGRLIMRHLHDSRRSRAGTHASSRLLRAMFARQVRMLAVAAVHLQRRRRAPSRGRRCSSVGRSRGGERVAADEGLALQDRLHRDVRAATRSRIALLQPG